MTRFLVQYALIGSLMAGMMFGALVTANHRIAQAELVDQEAFVAAPRSIDMVAEAQP